MSLTNLAITKAKSKDKSYKLSDAGGLYLQVNPSGSRVWKYDFRINGKRGTFTIGNYPEYPLKEAREHHLTARKLVSKGSNPTESKAKSRLVAELSEKRFSSFAKEWVAKQNYAESTKHDLEIRLEKNIYPKLDKKPVTQFTTLELLEILLEVTDRGARETAVRLANVIRRVFNELLILRLVEYNPAQGLAELLPKPNPREKGNFAHVTCPEQLKILLLGIHSPSNRQDPVTSCALKLMPLVFLRPKNIRFLKWEYIDFEANLITIPAEEMKRPFDMKVPLASQAIDILLEVKPITGKFEHVFVTSHGRPKPMSESTTTNALKRIIDPATGEPYGTGFMTSHGFRHTASTLLNERGYSPDAIELQLSHINKDRIRATYNKAQLMDERTRMMQDWANFIYSLLA